MTSRWKTVLLVLLAVELAAGGWFLARRATAPRPPLVDLTILPPEARGHLETLLADAAGGGRRQWETLAEGLTAFGYFPEAAACYREALRHGRGDGELHSALAQCLSQLGKYEEAAAQFRKAATAAEAGGQRKAAARARYFLGRTLLCLGQPDEALAAFQDAGDLGAAQYEAARLLVRSDDYDQAEKLLAAVENRHGDIQQVHSLRARIAVLQDERDAELERAERAEWCTRMLPTPFDRESTRLYAARDQAGTSQRLQRLQQLEGDLPAILAELERAAEQDLPNAFFDQRRAQIHLQLGDPAKAEQILRQLITREGPDPHVLWRLGDICLQTDRREETLTLWRRAAATMPIRQAASIHRELGELLRGERLPGAQQQEALGIFCRGYDDFWQGNLREARQRFEEAAAKYGNEARIWYYLGETHRRLRRRADAEDAFRQCLRIAPEHGRALAALARLAAVEATPDPR